jgi:hypothetical protein
MLLRAVLTCLKRDLIVGRAELEVEGVIDWVSTVVGAEIAPGPAA